MADKIKVRDVGLREIYDSYMGILRISPNEEMEDDITEQLLDGTEIQLSDSDGNALSLTFVGKSKETVIKLNKDTSKLVNFISVVSKVKDVLFACKSANIRSTLYLGRKKEDNTNSNLLVVSQEYKSDAGRKDILLYPIDSPYNKLYWNDKSRPPAERIELEYSDDNDAILEEKLLERNPDWYDNPYKIKDYVKVNGKPVYVTNNNDELIPVLYNKCCVLGNRVDATGKLTDFLKGEYVQSAYYRYDHLYTYPDIRSESILSSQSFITRLSYFDIDKMIWEGIDEVAKGKIRHTSAGRYEELGAKADTNLKNEVFCIKPNKDDFSIALDPSPGTDMQRLRAHSLVDTAPLLGTSVTPGIIMYNAMPMKKFAYNALRQIKANYEKNYITTQQFKNNANVINIQTFSNNGINLTRATTGEKTSAIRLVKNFVLCNGATIAGTEYGNHPHLDSKNERLAQIMPVNGQAENCTIYSEITKTINLLDFNTTSNRFLRGQMWYFTNSMGQDVKCKDSDDDESESVVDIKDTQETGNGYGDVKQGDHECEIEVIRMDTADNPYSTRKNFGESMLPYMVNYDSKIQRKAHRHYMFSSKEGTAEAEEYTYTGNIPVMFRGIFGSRYRTRYGTAKAKNVISGQAVCRHDVENWTGWMRGDRDINYYENIPWYVNAKGIAADKQSKDPLKCGLNIIGTNYSPYNCDEEKFSDIVIKRNNECEALKPISRWGGSKGMKHENGYTVRRGHNHKGEKHKTKYLYSYDLVGGYQIAGAMHEIGDIWGEDGNDSKRYIEVGLSSGPYNNRENLGNEKANTLIKDKAGEELGDKTEFRKIVSIGGSDNIKLYNNTPNPASISLLPLLRI